MTNFALLARLFGIGAIICIGQDMLCPPYAGFFLPPFPIGQCPNFLDFLNLWGKVLERSGLRLKKTVVHKGCRIAAAQKVSYRFFHLFTQFKHCFASTSQSQISKFFTLIFFDILEEKSKKKWSQIWNFLLIKVSNCRAKKIAFVALLAEFFCYCCYYPHWSRNSLCPVCGIFWQCSILII